jgi:hypothetical protein
MTIAPAIILALSLSLLTAAGLARAPRLRTLPLLLRRDRRTR